MARNASRWLIRDAVAATGDFLTGFHDSMIVLVGGNAGDGAGLGAWRRGGGGSFALKHERCGRCDWFSATDFADFMAGGVAVAGADGSPERAKYTSPGQRPVE
jgi:hypothetical protein